MDVADGHISALQKLFAEENIGKLFALQTYV